MIPLWFKDVAFWASRPMTVQRDELMAVMGMITVPKSEYKQMVAELETLRRTDLYKRLLEFMQNVQKKKFTRADLGF
ncbi:hypothetical protein HY489_00320 [Candidatus Woesearchaeota archaeon]|nr:hypothetical protein [Candidatus Woesearchaeota archaeon]